MRSALLLILGACLLAAEPDTPSGQTFTKWLEAFNSGDKVKMEEFLRTYLPARLALVREEMEFRAATGGFDVTSTESPSPLRLTALLRERGGEKQPARLTLEVEAEPPHRIREMNIRAQRQPEQPVARLSQTRALEALTAKADAAAAEGTFAGVVAVAKNGKLIFSRAWGDADRATGKPNTTATQFRIGSMNKMFTAVAVLQLVQAGKLNLDEPFGTYLPDYPNRGVSQNVTIHHLLTHTGATGDIFGPEFEKNRLTLRTLGDYMRLFGTRELNGTPGERFRYSNFGFILLGAVIEKVSGVDYYTYVREKIYRPAGMTHTDSLPESESVPGRATGYTKFRRQDVSPNTDTLPFRGTSAGGGYSTAEDLIRFAAALTGHKLLDAAHTKLLITAKVKPEPGLGYGYGFMEGTGDVPWFGHGGGAPGMNGELFIYPESGYAVAVLANVDPPAASRLARFTGSVLPAK